MKYSNKTILISSLKNPYLFTAKLNNVLCFFQVSHGRLATARKPERQVTRMVVVMIVAFMVGWTPYAAFSILVTAYPTIELDPRLASIPAFFSKTAAVYNPIIYVFMNKQVAEGFHVRKEYYFI